jgi:RHS repeat-associated protein
MARKTPLFIAHRVSIAFRCCLLVSVVAFLFLARGFAQMLTVGDDTSTPIEGAGHNYIKALSETVNPANGSVSLRISLPMPKGRGIMLPFSISYDTNGIVNLSAPSAIPIWYSPTPGSQFLSSGGWSYGFPLLTSSEWNNTLYDGGTKGNSTVTCEYRAGYIFQDPLGGRHSLALGTTGYQSGSNGHVLCGSPQTAYPEPQFWGVFDEPPSHTGDLLTPVVVSDNDGTRYYFPGFVSQELPNYIEDRNGNVISFSSADINADPITVTDTAGRLVLSSSAFGTGTTTISTPDQAYSVVWESNSASYTIPVTIVRTVSGDPGHSCSAVGTSVNVNGNVISSISLPNGQEYKLYYGTNPNSSYNNPYGLLSEIDYPTGAWVRYTWKLSDNPNEPVIYDAVCAAGDPGCKPTPNACQAEYQSPVVATRTVGYGGTSPAQLQTFSYNTQWNTSANPISWSSKSTKVTTTDEVRGLSALTTHTYSSVSGIGTPYVEFAVAQQIPVESSIQSYNWGNTSSPIRTVNKTWQNQYLLTSEQLVLNDDSNLSSLVTHSYNSNEQPQEKDEYDFGSSSVTRKTVTNYESIAITSLNGRIVDKPCQTIVYDGSGNRYSETDYFYDNGGTGTVCGPAGTPSVTGVSNLTQHDETNYSASSTFPRGNVTTMVKQCFQGATTCATGNPTTTYTYDETGQRLSMTDPNLNVTNYYFNDSYLSTNTGSYTTTAGSPPSGEMSDAYLTKIKNALNQTVTFTYGYNDGELTTATDENTQTTIYRYNDSLDRPTEVDYPDAGATKLAYTDTPPSPTVTTCELISGSASAACSSTSPPTGWKTTVDTFDGMGHSVEMSLPSDPSGTTYTATTYDGTGKPYKVYNPTRCNPATTNCGTETTWGYSTYSYDALGRTTQVAHSDGTQAITSYMGRATSTLDEGNGTKPVQRISQVDGLGRLTSVCEVTSSTELGSGGTPAACGQDIAGTGFLTTYSHDTLGNLLAVNQGTLGQRTFAYDSLSRLLCAANPETGTAACPNPDNGTYTAGTTRYAYDANGNLSSRTRPAPNQTLGTVTVAATYQYDALNRLTQKSYSDGVTPNARFGYDQASVTMGTEQFNIANSIGRLSFECTLSPSTCTSAAGNMDAFSYDPMGRTAQLWQCQHLNCPLPNFVFSYDYDLIGDELDYFVGEGPHGSTEYVSTYSSAGRLTSFTTPTWVDATNPANLLTSVQYDPFGHIISGNLANGLSLSSAYDGRGHVTAMAVGTTPCSAGNCSTNKYRFTTGYAPNSDIVSSTDTVNGNWTYTYDDLNRLSTGVANNGEGCSWDYDRYGNRWHQNAYSGSCTAPQFSFSGNNNRIDGYSYDAAGNLLYDGFHNYTYDAENRIVSVDGGATTYIYDAEGRRYSKTTGGVPEETRYDRLGNPLYRGNFGPSEIFAAGMHLGTYNVNSAHTGTIFYYDHDDWLGTERARTDLSGTACETITSLPFGDNQTITSTCGDLSPLHFTGKERDSESNLDNFGARYFTSTIGRFMTPDWAARPATIPYAVFGDPQSLNLYTYVRNDPVTVADADGHTPWLGEVSESACVEDPWCFAGITEGREDVVAGKDEATKATLTAQNQTPKPGRQEDGSYIAPTGPGSEIAKITDLTNPLPPMIGNGQCVTACAHFSGVTGDTKQWTEGPAVADNSSIPKGTAIATFDSNGRYPTNADRNSGIYMGQGTKKGSILILDQWPAHPQSGTPAHPAQIREMRPDDGKTRSNSAKAYYVIIVPR